MCQKGLRCTPETNNTIYISYHSAGEMKNFSSLLKDLEEILKKYNPINYDLLMPPLPKNEMNMFLEKLGIDDENARHLYEWKNGVNVSEGLDPSQDFMDYGVLYPLHAILRSVNLYPDEYAQMIPLISNAMGDRLLLNINLGDDYGKIFLESTSLLSLDDEKFNLYDSVYSMIETTIECNSKGAFNYDMKNHRLVKDIDKYYEIAATLNKKSSYWTAG